MNSALCARRCFKCQASILFEIWQQKLSLILMKILGIFTLPGIFLVCCMNWTQSSI